MPGRPHDTEPSFNQTLLHAIDNGFLTLGSVMIEPLYHRIERSHQVKREEIPQKLPDFRRALQEIMNSGAEVMERQIAKSLYVRLGLDFVNHANWTLIDYVNDAKRNLEVE